MHIGRKRKGHTSNGTGTLLLERKIGKIDIRRASGTKSVEELGEIIALLEAFATAGRRDLVAKVALGEIRGVELLRLAQAGQLPHPPTNGKTPQNLADIIREQRLALPLAGAIEAMLAEKRGRQSHLKEMRRQLLAMAKRHPQKRVRDLLGVLILERSAYLAENHRAAFTRLRANSMVLAGWADGVQNGPIWNDIRTQIGTTRVRPKERRKHNPFTPTEVQLFRAELNAECKDAGEVFLSLCLTGMRPSEYWSGNWSMGFDHIKINGTKNDNADRKAPLVAKVVNPSLTLVGWGRIFRRVAKRLGHTAYSKEGQLHWWPYDCRRTFAHWCDAAGVPRGRAAYYLGHAPETITDKYAYKPPSSKEIGQDAARLLAFFAAFIKAEKAAHAKMKSVARTHMAAQKSLSADLTL
jgi:integrase